MKEDHEDLVFLGEIVNTRGLKGEVKLTSYLSLSSFALKSQRDILNSMKDVYLLTPAGEKKGVRILEMREERGYIVLKFAGYDTISQAEQLKKCKVAFRRIPLLTGAYYVRDLIGMEVFKKEKMGLCRIGKIVDILGTGANDIYLIKEKTREIMFPALKSLVKEIDLDKKRMIIDLPEGL